MENRKCSKTEDFEKEIKHLETVFCETNDYPAIVVKDVIDEERKRQHEMKEPSTTVPTTDDSANEEDKTIYINLPFAGPNGETLVRKLRQQIEKKSQNLKIRVTYTPTKLGSKFIVKDKTKDESLHNVT